MSQHPTPTVPVPAAQNSADPSASIRWTGDKASAFLRALSRHGKVARAARSVGMSRQAAYRLKARAPIFAEYWERAMKVAAGRRAAVPGRKPVHPLLQRDIAGEKG